MSRSVDLNVGLCRQYTLRDGSDALTDGSTRKHLTSPTRESSWFQVPFVHTSFLDTFPELRALVKKHKLSTR